MMKNTMRVFVLAAFMLVAMSLSAQQQQKIGHIETKKLIQAMPEMTTAQKTLETKQNDVEKELTNMREQFQIKLTEYSEKVKTYSDIVRNAKEQELQEMQARIQRFQESAVAELEKEQGALMQPIMDKALNAIKEVAKENGFTYILDMSSGVVLYAVEGSLDILPLVKAKLKLP